MACTIFQSLRFLSFLSIRHFLCTNQGWNLLLEERVVRIESVMQKFLQFMKLMGLRFVLKDLVTLKRNDTEDDFINTRAVTFREAMKVYDTTTFFFFALPRRDPFSFFPEAPQGNGAA